MNAKDKAAEVKAPTMQDLMQLVLSNKATSEQKKELSRLLDQSAEEESKQEFQKKIDRIKVVIEEEGLTIQEVYDSMKQPQQPIFVYIDEAKVSHQVFGPMRGKQPVWIAEMKKNVTKEKALEMALSESGKQWVEKTYSK